MTHSRARHTQPLIGLLFVLLLCLALAAPSPAAAAGVGLQLHPMWSGYTPEQLGRQLDQVAAAKGSYVRFDVSWGSLEPERQGEFSLDQLRRIDAVVDGARARGLKPIVTLADSPCWASGAPASVRGDCAGAWWERDITRYLPRDPADYGDALARLATRYGTRVAAWEIWNEPNLDGFLRGPDKAARYAALVKAAYAKAKAASPESTFVAGALSESDTGFLQSLYDHGIKGSYDALSIHPYSHDVSPLASRAAAYREASFVTGVPAVRAVMTRNGDAAALWLTEFGWSTNTRRGSAPWRNGIDEAQQATYVRQAIAQLPEWDYVPVAIYYGLADQAGSPSELLANYGLTRVDGSPKPALAAFSAAVTALEASIPPAPVPERVSPPPVSARAAPAFPTPRPTETPTPTAQPDP